MMGNVGNLIKESFYVRYLQYLLKYKFPTIILGDENRIRKQFKAKCGYYPNLENPKRLNEKMQWLKLHDHRDICTMVVDKYKVRDYYKSLGPTGEEHLVPLLKKLDSWKDVTMESLPDEPFIIKCNTGTGTWQIVRDKSKIDIKKLRNECRKWMYINQYYKTQEWQYKNVCPCIIIEKLLTDNNGKVPNDIKLHYFNGELQFVYCVVDREGENYRALFDRDWNLLPFQYVSKTKYKVINKPITEPRPKTLDEMIRFGDIIAQSFKYVRVDYYEVEGKMYFGEITLYHGAGYNRFYPEEYENEYSEKLKIM